jgi:hypothetical protein
MSVAFRALNHAGTGDFEAWSVSRKALDPPIGPGTASEWLLSGLAPTDSNRCRGIARGCIIDETNERNETDSAHGVYHEVSGGLRTPNIGSPRNNLEFRAHGCRSVMGGTGLRFLEHPWMSKRSEAAGPATTCPGLADLTTLCLAGRPVSCASRFPEGTRVRTECRLRESPSWCGQKQDWSCG